MVGKMTPAIDREKDSQPPTRNQVNLDGFEELVSLAFLQ